MLIYIYSYIFCSLLLKYQVQARNTKRIIAYIYAKLNPAQFDLFIFLNSDQKWDARFFFFFHAFGMWKKNHVLMKFCLFDFFKICLMYFVVVKFSQFLTEKSQHFVWHNTLLLSQHFFNTIIIQVLLLVCQIPMVINLLTLPRWPIFTPFLFFFFFFFFHCFLPLLVFSGECISSFNSPGRCFLILYVVYPFQMPRKLPYLNPTTS